jgi:hypothetical protein
VRQAFKEWAVICRALAEGRQALILRKGGIAETDNGFRLEQPLFWLLPTYFHEQRAAIKPEAMPLLEKAEAERPAAGTVRLSHFAKLGGAYLVHELTPVLMLDHLHLWSEDTVRARFVYRQPGLFVLPVRVYRLPHVVELPDRPDYAGCRSWVELENDLPTDHRIPVLEEDAFRVLLRSLDLILNPTALA